MDQSGQPSLTGWVFLLFLSIYLLTAGGHYYSSDGQTMFNLARALLLRQEVAMEPWTPLAASSLTINNKGQRMPVTMPGQSIALLPLVALGERTAGLVSLDKRVFWVHFVSSFTNAFVVAGLVAIFFSSLGRLGYGTGVRLATTSLLGLGTLLWPYAKLDFAEPLLGLLLFGAAELIWRYRQSGRLAAAVGSGLLLGAATFTKIAGGFLGLPILVYFTAGEISVGYKSGRYRAAAWRLLAVALAVSVGIGLVFYYNWLRFGTLREFGYGEPVTFTNPLLLGLYGLVLSSGKGLLFFAPATALFLPALGRFRRRHRPEAATCLAVVLLGLVFFSTWRAWHGDVAWGPRYLVYLMPFFLLPVAALVRDYGSLGSPAKAAIVLVAAWALGTQLIGISVFYNTYLNDSMKKTSPRETALSAYWFNPRFAPIPGEAKLLKPFFRRWLKRLRTREYRRVPAEAEPAFEWFYQKVPDIWWVYLSLSSLSNWLALALLPLALLVISVWRFLALRM